MSNKVDKTHLKLTQRKINALETKNAIRKAALELFSQRSFSSVTIDDITTQAGVSKGSFYTHFASKESVLVDEFRKIDLCYIRLMDNIDSSLPVREKLLLLILEMTKYVSEVVDVTFMSIVYMNQISPEKTVNILTNHDRMLFKYVNELIKEGIEKGEFRKFDDVKNVVEWFLRSARALIYDWCLYNGSFDIKKEGQIYFSDIIDSFLV